MPRLIVAIDIDVDPRFEDPYEVAQELLGGRNDTSEPVNYAGVVPEFLHAEWVL